MDPKLQQTDDTAPGVPHPLFKVHGHNVIGCVQTGRFDSVTKQEALIILVDRGPSYGSDRYITGFMWTGDKEWSNGYYTGSIQKALFSLGSRAELERNSSNTLGASERKLKEVEADLEAGLNDEEMTELQMERCLNRVREVLKMF